MSISRLRRLEFVTALSRHHWSNPKTTRSLAFFQGISRPALNKTMLARTDFRHHRGAAVTGEAGAYAGENASLCRAKRAVEHVIDRPPHRLEVNRLLERGIDVEALSRREELPVEGTGHGDDSDGWP
jgi:hypothetical protein